MGLYIGRYILILYRCVGFLCAANERRRRLKPSIKRTNQINGVTLFFSILCTLFIRRDG